MEESLPVSIESIRRILRGNKINVQDIKTIVGPSVTLYKIYPEQGTRASRVKALEDDFHLSVLAPSVRIITLDDCFGIEIPNTPEKDVKLSSLLESREYLLAKETHALPVALGMNIDGSTRVEDLSGLPHLLIAGATGQGKTMSMIGLICSLCHLMTEKELQLVLIDPKGIELSPFEGLGDACFAAVADDNSKVISDTGSALSALQSLIGELETRYELLKASGCKNIHEYRDSVKSGSTMPYIVAFINEYGDLVGRSCKEAKTILASILKIAQQGRTVGIHLVISTQRPSYPIINGLIKANFPSRLAFRVSTKEDSRIIIDRSGAEKLSGNGDALFETGGELARIQSGTITPEEVESLIKQTNDHLKKK